MNTPHADFFQQAKLYKLTKDEADFIFSYAQKSSIPPTRVLVNSDLFEKIAKHYIQDTIIANHALLQNIRRKLSFDTTLPKTLHSTKEIEIAQRGKLHIDSNHFIPIRLHRSDDTHMLWEVMPHEKRISLQEKQKGYILFEKRHLIAYRFDTLVEKIRQIGGKRYLKIPHSDNIELLARRKYPRIEVDIDGFIKKVSKLTEPQPLVACKVTNISEGGAKICLAMSGANFKDKEQVILKFTLDFTNIETTSEVQAQIVYKGEECYGLKFVRMDEKTRFVIAKFIAKNLGK